MSTLLSQIKTHLLSLSKAELKRQATLNKLELPDNIEDSLILDRLLGLITEGYCEYKNILITESETFQKNLKEGALNDLEKSCMDIDDFAAIRLLGIGYYINSRYHKTELISKKLEDLSINEKHLHSFLDIQVVEGLLLEIIKLGYFINLKSLLSCIDLAYRDRILFIFFKDLQKEEHIKYDKRKKANDFFIFLSNIQRRIKYKKVNEINDSMLLKFGEFIQNPFPIEKAEFNSLLDNFFMHMIIALSGSDGVRDIKSAFLLLKRLTLKKHSPYIAHNLKNSIKSYCQNEEMRNKCLHELQPLFFFIFENKDQGLLQPNEYLISEKYYGNYKKYYLLRLKALLNLKSSESTS